jgi:hypothetical protein
MIMPLIVTFVVIATIMVVIASAGEKASAEAAG